MMDRKSFLFKSCVLNIFLIFCFGSANANAEELWCKVTRKLDSAGNEYTKAQLERFKPGVFVRSNNVVTTLSRCSYEFSGKHSCDDYVADRVEVDPNVGHRKFYYYRGQFDVQGFSDNSFIENNGRGTISFGQCWVQ